MRTLGRSIRQQPDGRFVVRYRFGQKERRKLFATYALAREFVQDEQNRIRLFGKTAVELTGSQLGRVMHLIAELGQESREQGKLLTRGVREMEKATVYWLKHREEVHQSAEDAAIHVDAAVEKLLASWKRENKNKGYISNAGSVLHRFGREHPGRELRHFKAGQLREWVLKQPPKTHSTHKARLSALFSFAVLHGWVPSNPCALFRLARQKRDAIAIPSAADIEQFLVEAQKPKWKSLLPYFCVRLFAGLRAAEARALRWSHVSLTRKRILVPMGVVAKGGAPREAPASDNLLTWLLPQIPLSLDTLVAPEGVDELEREFKRECGFVEEKWHNALRHSFGSYRYPILGNLDQLAGEMGNSRRVLCSHYIGAVSDDDVKIFWTLVPSI